jgi:YesN/AraC family two-component response regulator
MVSGYVLKPFRKRDLKAAIETVLYTRKVDKERKFAEGVQIFGQISKLLGNDLFDMRELEDKSDIQNIEKEIIDKSGRKHTLLINVKRVLINPGTK